MYFDESFEKIAILFIVFFNCEFFRLVDKFVLIEECVGYDRHIHVFLLA
jgi:hypothetical protein